MPSNEKEEPKSKSVSIRLPRDVYEKALAKAEADDRTLSNYIFHLISKSVEGQSDEEVSKLLREILDSQKLSSPFSKETEDDSDVDS